MFETEEVANEDGRRFLVDHTAEGLELLITACPCCKLQRGNGLRIPGMSYAVVAPMELSLVWKECHFPAVCPCGCSLLHGNGINGNLLQSDASHTAHFRTEVFL